MTIQGTINEANQIIHKAANDGTLSKRMLAVGREMNRKYIDYLDELLDADLQINTGVTVSVKGQLVKFPNMDAFSSWLAENME